MRIEPVRRKVAPRYPTSDILNEHPEMLYIVPARWRSNALVLKILGGAACLLLASQTAWAEKPNVAPATRIAPVFVHGDGRGAFGCVVVNPPAFLSEDEARQVIQEEAKKAGLNFAPHGLTIQDVQLPVTNPSSCLGTDGIKPPPLVEEGSERRALALDGFDQEHNVAYEFVSSKDFWAWGNKHPRCRSTVADSDTKGAAEMLRKELKSGANHPWIGVFYEPFVDRPVARRFESLTTDAERQAYWSGRDVAGSKADAEQLRKQVRDFIQWLKAQGVI